MNCVIHPWPKASSRRGLYAVRCRYPNDEYLRSDGKWYSSADETSVFATSAEVLKALLRRTCFDKDYTIETWMTGERVGSLFAWRKGNLNENLYLHSDGSWHNSCGITALFDSSDAVVAAVGKGIDAEITELRAEMDERRRECALAVSSVRFRIAELESNR